MTGLFQRGWRCVIPYRREVIVALLVFCVALVIRVAYQDRAAARSYLSFDAKKYYVSAHNLVKSGVYSLEPPRADGRRPVSGTDLPPGYPGFLAPIIMASDSVKDSLLMTFSIQAVLGSLTAVLTFLLARLCVGVAWALAAGMLTALCPHLIILEGHVLSETLFAFLLMLGALLLAISWRRTNLFAALSGFALALSGVVRFVGFLVLAVTASLNLIKNRSSSYPPWAVRFRQLACLSAGVVIVLAAYAGFRGIVAGGGETDGKSGASALTVSDQFLLGSNPYWFEGTRERIKKERGAKVRRNIIKLHRQYHVRTFGGLMDRFVDEPWPYFKWYAFKKWACLWGWDQLFSGDIYIYPMAKRGFHGNPMMGLIRVSMGLLHWPLFFLGLCAPAFLIVTAVRKGWHEELKTLLIPLAVFASFMAVFLFMMPIPRYSMPARPFSYVLAAFSLSILVPAIKRVYRYGTGLKPGAVIDPKAIVGENCHIGNGTRVGAFSCIASGARVGMDCKIGSDACVGPEVRMADGCRMGSRVSVEGKVNFEPGVRCDPGVVFAESKPAFEETHVRTPVDSTVVGEGAIIESRVTIFSGANLGQYCQIGCGSVVNGNVPAYARFEGNPAVQKKWVCRCGAALSDELKCESCGRRYENHNKYRLSESGSVDV